MRLPFFRPKDTAPEPMPPQRLQRSPAAAASPEDLAVAAARTQARRRLVGAVLLLAVGVIGFPLLFETQPRPLPQDTPILVPAEPPATRAAGRVGPAAPAPVLPAVPADAGVEPVASAPVASAPAPVPAASKPKPAAAAPPAAPVASPPAPAAAPTPANGRWVVQVGAYNDMERLRAARAKLQLLGYASYTQDVDSPTGKRTRVRVGPFKSRAEAEAVAARVKTAGLQAAVLAL
ncbi:MAG: SPOR domain-containing protein [Betaproteobacteria bacterium]|jgi:DedD protein|nr:SPOR domain-containing protein [Rubrivivax sp.]